MKCSYCDEAADFKCTCQKSYMCQFHLGAHLRMKKNHQYETLDEYLGDSKLNQLRLKLIERIQKIITAKNEIASKTHSLIKSIEQALKTVSEQFDSIIESYVELLKHQKFCSSELQIIEKIELLDISVHSIKLDEIINTIQIAYSINLISFENTLQNGANQFLTKHNGGFWCGAVTGDYKILITGGYDSVIRVWDLTNKNQKFVLLGHNSIVSCLTLTGDEQHIISGSFDASVRIWNFKQNSRSIILKGHKGGVKGVCYLENRSLIVSGDHKREIIVWDFAKHNIIKKLLLTGAIWCLTLMKNSSFIIASEYKNIAFIEIETLNKLKTMQGHGSTVLSLALTSDEKKLVSGSWDKLIIVWDLIESQKILQLEGHKGPVNSLALTYDNRFVVSGSDDHTVCVWNILDGTQILNYQKHTLPVCAILKTDRAFFSLSKDSGIGRLDVNNGSFEVDQFLKPFQYNFVTFSNESKLVGYGNKNEAVIWDLKSEAKILVLLGHKSKVISVEISENGQFSLSCSFGKDMNLIYWDLVRNEKIAELKGHIDSVYCAAFNKDGLSAASGSADNTVRTWNLKNLKQDFEFQGHIGIVYSIKFINTKKLLVSTGVDKKVIIWNLRDKTQYAVFSGHKNIILRVLVTENENYVVSGNFTDGISIWDIKKKKMEYMFSFQTQASKWLKENKVQLDSVIRFLKV